MSSPNTPRSSDTIALCAEVLDEVRNRVATPSYNRAGLVPSIIHIGVGAFHRSHQAVYLNRYAEVTGDLSWGIRGAGILPHDKTLQQALKEQDFLYCTLEKDGELVVPRVIGSLVDFIVELDDPEQLIESLSSATTRIVTLTITEGGYKVNLGTGQFLAHDPDIQHDISNPEKPKTVFGYLAAALKRRKNQGILPFTILSCDNLQENGRVCREALLQFCGLLDPELSRWLDNCGAFPCSMVDRITPATTNADRLELRESYGIDDAWPVVSEPFLQWIIEDTFTLGRPELEKVGVQFAADVAPYEKMKLRLLNASHSAIGYLGYLCGYRTIHEIARDPRFITLLKRYMQEEALPTLDPVQGIDLLAYCQSLIKRFQNPAIKDQTLRICKDGSAKIPRFLLPVIHERRAQRHTPQIAALVVASWWRFLIGVDEQGALIPLEDSSAELLSNAAQKGIAHFLSLAEIFGPLSEDTIFRELVKSYSTALTSKGVEATLTAVLNENLAE
jgi:mannitol 2-dehydrogenase